MLMKCVNISTNYSCHIHTVHSVQVWLPQIIGVTELTPWLKATPKQEGVKPKMTNIPGVRWCIWVEELIGHLSGIPGHRHQCA